MLSKCEQQTTLSKHYFPFCLTLNEFYEKNNFEEKISRRQQNHEKLPSMQNVEGKKIKMQRTISADDMFSAYTMLKLHQY